MIRKLEDMWGFYHLEGMEDQVPEFNPYPGKGKSTARKPTLQELSSRSCSSREHEEAHRRAYGSGGAVGRQPERTPLPSRPDDNPHGHDRSLSRPQQITNNKGMVKSSVANLEAAIAQLKTAKEHAVKHKVRVCTYLYIPHTIDK